MLLLVISVARRGARGELVTAFWGQRRGREAMKSLRDGWGSARRSVGTAFMLGGCLAACSSGATPSGDSGAPLDGGGGEAGPGTCTAPPTATSSTEYLCTVGGGMCNSCSDCTLVMNGTAKTQASSCGASCIGQSDACITSCLSSKTPTLSGTCQTCMVGLFDCTVKYCTSPCVTGTAAQCSACLMANPAPGPTSCDSVFLQCGGLSNNPGYTG